GAQTAHQPSCTVASTVSPVARVSSTALTSVPARPKAEVTAPSPVLPSDQDVVPAWRTVTSRAPGSVIGVPGCVELPTASWPWAAVVTKQSPKTPSPASTTYVYAPRASV